MMDLLLTLGHNASCIAIKDNQIVGYEQERLDHVKSSSRYPRDAIEQCLAHIKANRTDENTISITHWFDDFQFIDNHSDRLSKYIDFAHILQLKEMLGCRAHFRANLAMYYGNEKKLRAYFENNCTRRYLNNIDCKGLSLYERHTATAVEYFATRINA